MSITVTSRQSPSSRMTALLSAYEKSPLGCEVCFRVGNSMTGDAAILVSFDDQDFPLLTHEARALAAIMRESIERFSIPGNTYGIKQMADGLLDAARKAEKATPSSALSAHPPSGKGEVKK